MKNPRQKFLEKKIGEIQKKLKRKGSAIVAFSGGVDSSVVAALAYKALKDRALAVTVDSPLLPSGELEDAGRIAAKIGINHVVIQSNELEIPRFKNNPPNRCYLCKRFRFGKLREMAEEMGFQTVIDGTNLSDLGDYRPGLRAMKEEGVYSPLLEAGLSKEDSRSIAKLLHLPTADKPASACLASRIPYHSELTLNRLKRIASAENYIKKVANVKVVRVRDHGDLARIEIGRHERKKFFNDKLLDKVTQKLQKLGYRYVTLDLMGYRFGSFDEPLKSKAT